MANRIEGGSRNADNYQVAEADAERAGAGKSKEADKKETDSGGWSFGDTWNDVTNAVGDAADGIKREVGEAVDGVKREVGEAVDGVKEEVEEAVDDIKEEVGEAVDGVKREVGEAVDEVEREIDEAVDGVKEEVDEAVDGVKKEVGETVAEVKQDVTRTVAEVQQEVQQTVSQGAEEVREALDDFDKQLQELEEVPRDVIEGGQALYREVQQTQVRFVEELDRIIESHPEEVVIEAAEQALEGSWEIGKDIARTVFEVHQQLNPTPQLTPEDLQRGVELLERGLDAALEVGNDYVLQPLVSLKKGTEEAVEALGFEIVMAGAKAVVANESLLQEVGGFVEAVLDNELVDTVIALQTFTPHGMALRAARAGALKLAQGVQEAPGGAQQLVDNPKIVRNLVDITDAEDIAAELRELPVGDGYRKQLAFELSAHAKAGGKLGMGMTCEVMRTAEDTYQVSISADAQLGAGLGAETQGKGGRGDIVQNLGGKLVVEFSGPDAAEDAARLVAATSGKPEELLRLSGESGAIVEAVGTFGPDGEVEAFGAKFDGGARFEPSYKLINGEPHVGITASIGASLGMDNDSVQVGEDLSESWLQSDTVGDPTIDTMIEQLPEGLVSDVKSVYGPKAGITLAAEPKASVSVFRPADATEPIRASFQAEVTLKAGRTQIKGELGFTVTDVRKLATAMEMSEDKLIDNLSRGQVSLATLRESAEEMGFNLDRYVEFQPPKLSMAAEDIQGLNNALGITMRSGTIDNTVLYEPPDEVDFADNLRMALEAAKDGDKMTDQTDPDDPQARLATAHATRV